MSFNIVHDTAASAPKNLNRFLPQASRAVALLLLVGGAVFGAASCGGDDTSGTGGAAGVAGTTAGAGGTAGTGGTGNPTAKCEEDIATAPPCDAPTQFLKNKLRCANIACHSTRGVAAHLNLESPCVARRLIGVMSDPAEDCAGRVLVEAANPLNSLFVQKLAPVPVCGEQMPNTSPKLTPDEQACLTNWISWLVQNQ